MQIKIILLTLLLASCILKPYQMDIHQGNSITAEMRDKLKLGMTKQQVRYVLGTPLINDAFHGNRWDYVYSHEHGGKVIERQRLTLNFLDNALQSIDDGIQLVQAEPSPPKITPEPVIAPVAIAPQPVAPIATTPIVDTPVVVGIPVADEPVVDTPVVDTPSPIDSTAEVKVAVEAWAAAWSAQDVTRYFSSYARTFKPVGMSKAAWQTQRKQRISKPNAIAVTLSDLKIEQLDDTHVSATFLQEYRADSYQDKTPKILQLEKLDGAWLIVSEQAVK